MATRTVSFSESTTRSQSQTVNISDLSSVNDVSVNTGSVTYSVSGKDVTVNVSNGTATRSETGGTQTQYCTASETVTCSQSWAWDGDGWVTNGSISYNSSSSYYYNDGTFSGYIPHTGNSGGSTNSPSGSGYFGETRTGYGSGTASYGGTLSATGATVYYYAYTVTITYTAITQSSGSLQLIGSTDETLTVRITGLEFGSNYNQLVINGPGGNRGVTIAGSDGFSYYTSGAVFTGLSPLTSYSFTGYITHSTQVQGTTSANYSTLAPIDSTPPTITLSLSAASGTSIAATWSATDNKAMRATNTFYLYISETDDVSNHHLKATLNNGATNYTFTTEGLGRPFVSNKTYSVQIYAYDETGNMGEVTKSILFKKTKPSFAWTNPKTQEGTYNLTADEWNAFLGKINLFEDYKGLPMTNFNQGYYDTPTTYIVPLDTAYNAARSIIIGLGATIMPPPAVTVGDIITAYHLNQIVASLNSIP